MATAQLTIDDIDAHTPHRPIFGRKAATSASVPVAATTAAPSTTKPNETSDKRFLRQPLTVLRKVMRGEMGLSWTFWGWAVLYALPLGAVSLSVLYIARQYGYDTWMGWSLAFAAQLINITWGIFISISLINAARFNRRRGFWGWAATLGALCTLAFMPLQMYVAIYPEWREWQFIDAHVAAINEAAPIRIDNVLTITSVEASQQDNTLTYRLSADVATINDTTFDAQAVKQHEIKSCDSFDFFFVGPGETVRMAYAANDGSIGEIEITKADCAAKT